jgi:GTP cyclohydrolase I
MDWQPQEEPLKQLAHCLRDSLAARDANVRVNAELVSQSMPAIPSLTGADVPSHV